MYRIRTIQLLFVLGFFAAGVHASDSGSGFWGGLGEAFSKMGGDLSDAVTGKATKHNQTTDEIVDLVANHSVPTSAGQKAEVPVDIKEIQARLTALGYSPGPIDGAFGKKTGAAISAFQAAQGLPVDGRPSSNLVVALRSKTGGAAGNAGFIDSLASGIGGLFGSRAGSPGIGRAIANNTQAMLAGKQGNSVASALVSNQLNSMLPGQVAPLVNGVAAQRQLSQPSTNISQNGLANLAASRLLGQSTAGVLGASQPQAQSYLQRMTAQQQGIVGNVIANSLATHPPAAGGMAGIGLGAANSVSAPQGFDGNLKNFPKLRKVLAEMDPSERAQLMPIALNAIKKVSPTDLAMYKQAGSDVDGMLARQIAGYAQNYKRGRIHSPLTTKAPSIVRRPASVLSVGNWPSSLNGAWEGDGFANLPNISNNLPKDYSRKTRVRLFFNKEKGIYEIRYSGLGCSGVLKLIKTDLSPAGSAAQNYLLKFRESLVTKGGFCRDGGLVEILVKEEILPNPALPKTVKIRYLSWSHPSTHKTGIFAPHLSHVEISDNDGNLHNFGADETLKTTPPKSRKDVARKFADRSANEPSDILYSSLGDNNNYGEYRKIFADQRIKKLVASVESHRSVELNYRILVAFMKIYGRESTAELGNALRMKEALARLDSGQSNNEGVFRSLELFLEQVATENGLQYSDMRIFNDARNINQPEIAAIEDVALDPSWRLLPPHEAAFHVLGYDPETIRKYVSDDGKEFVFQLRDNHWVFIKDGVNSGTYNYSTKKIAHFVLDMAPWVLWGTGAEERLTKEKRLDVAREEFKPYVNAKIAELESQLQGAGKELLKKAADNMIAAAGMVKTATAAVGAKAAGALDDLDSIAIFLKANYPDTYEYIQNYSLGDDAVKETQLKIAYVIAKYVQSPKVGATISERLGLDAKGFVKFAMTRSTSSMVKSGMSVSKDIAGSMLEDAIVSTAAALATDVLFKIEPMESVAQNLEGPLRAMVESSLVEMYYAQKALKDPTVIISRLFDRYQQVRKIVATSRSLARTQDRGLLAAALTADTAAYLVTKFPTEKSIQVAEATLQDTKENIKDIVGKDDEDAVWHIVQLGYDAMKANYIGNTQEKEAEIVEIKRLGRVSGNIYPWSSIVHPVDWLTAAANWGKDAPERAAEIMLGSTSLVSDAKIATNSSALHSTPVLPAKRE